MLPLPAVAVTLNWFAAANWQTFCTVVDGCTDTMGAALIVTDIACGRLVSDVMLLITVILPVYVPAGALGGSGILRGEAGRFAVLISAMPAALAALSQSILYWLGLPVVVNDKLADVLCSQTAAIGDGVIVGRGALRAQPSFLYTGGLLPHHTALPSPLLGQPLLLYVTTFEVQLLAPFAT